MSKCVSHNTLIMDSGVIQANAIGGSGGDIHNSKLVNLKAAQKSFGNGFVAQIA